MLEFMDLPQELLSEAMKQACHNQGPKNRFFQSIFRRKIDFRLDWKRFWEGKSVCKKINEKSPIFRYFP